MPDTTCSADGAFRKLWDAGFRRLVPVIPPDAPISEKSTLAARVGTEMDPRGKSPGVLRGDEWTGFNFVAHEASELDLAEWQKMGASVGVKTGHGLVALDIDTTDEAASEALQALAREMLGNAPVRIGRAPKALLLYRVPADPGYDKVTFSTDTEAHALVELLSEGRQFVAEGIHPKTGKPYTWPGGLPRIEDIPETTAEALAAYMDAVSDRMPRSQRITASRVDREQIDQDKLKADLHLIEEAVTALPNTSSDFPSRDSYLQVGYAIKAACGPENEELALQLYLDWCAKWEGGNDPDAAAADFARMKPPFSLGAEWLFEKAERLGSWNGRAMALFGAPPAPATSTQDWKPGEGLAGIPDSIDLSIFAPSGAASVAKPAKGFRFLTIDDIMSLPDPEFLIDRHIPKQSFGLIFGEPGSKKSFLALDLALHVSLGREDWHGDRITSDPDAHVLYIAGEGVSGMKQRIRAWLDVHGREGDDLSRFRLLPMAVDFMRDEAVADLAQAIAAQKLSNMSLIIVDTVSRAIAGADENSAQDMSRFVKACDTIKDIFQTVVLGVHHANKAGGMRGSSAILGACDFVFQTENSKGSKIVKFICAKQKDAADAWLDTYAMAEVGGSLVPMRKDEEPRPEGTGEVSAATLSLSIEVIDKAWISGKPLAGSKRSKSRFAGAAIARECDVSEERAEAILDLLKGCGAVVEGIRDAANKISGLRVMMEASESLVADLERQEDEARLEEQRRAEQVFRPAVAPSPDKDIFG